MYLGTKSLSVQNPPDLCSQNGIKALKQTGKGVNFSTELRKASRYSSYSQFTNMHCIF